MLSMRDQQDDQDIKVSLIVECDQKNCKVCKLKLGHAFDIYLSIGFFCTLGFMLLQKYPTLSKAISQLSLHPEDHVIFWIFPTTAGLITTAHTHYWSKCALIVFSSLYLLNRSDGLTKEIDYGSSHFGIIIRNILIMKF